MTTPTPPSAPAAVPAVLPLVTVDAPSSVGYRYGLFSAAAVVDPANQREFLAGVQWEPSCPDAPAPTTTAGLTAPATDPMDLDGHIGIAAPGVIHLYTGFTGDPAGRADLLDRARLALALVEQQSLEHYAWAGTPAGTTAYLADPATPVLAGSATSPVALADGIGLLERHISEHTGQVGALWVPRELAGRLATAQLVRTDGPRLVAPLGDPVVFAHGPGTGPGGAAAGPGQAWLYATGPVMVRRSSVLLPTLADALDRRTNDVYAIAQRMYSVGWSCTAAAVKVTLNPGGNP